MVHGAKRCEEETEGLSFCREASECLFLEIPSASFVKSKANYETSGFGKVIGEGGKLEGFWHKVEFSIDEGDGIYREGACVDGHWDFVEFFGFPCRISAAVLATLGARLKP